MTKKPPTSNGEEPSPKEGAAMDYSRLKGILEVFISEGCREYPPCLDEVLRDTARTSTVRLPWDLLKPLLCFRLEKVVKEAFMGARESMEDTSKELLAHLDRFNGPPFTIQRLCELILEPNKHYRSRRVFVRAVEKNLLVVSTVEPDLTWMKSPRLAQLLEDRPKHTEQIGPISEPHPEDDYAEGDKVDDLGEPGTAPTFWSQLRSLTPLESDDPDFTAAEGEEDQPPDLRDGTVLLSRKRSSSLRDSMEREETVVQEADSTVNISEHQGHLGAEGDGEGRREEEGEGGAKRARDASVLPELGVLKSLLEHTDPKLEVEKLGESDADQVITPPIPRELVKEDADVKLAEVFESGSMDTN
eukprot:Em0019g230a